MSPTLALHARISPPPPVFLDGWRGPDQNTHSSPFGLAESRIYKERAPPAIALVFLRGRPRNPCRTPQKECPPPLHFTPGSPPSPRLPWWLEGPRPKHTQLALRARRIPHIQGPFPAGHRLVFLRGPPRNPCTNPPKECPPPLALHARISPLPPSSLVVGGAPTKTHTAEENPLFFRSFAIKAQLFLAKFATGPQPPWGVQ